MAHDVFISHSSQDKAIADATCARLEARGIRCWIAPRDVQPGQPYGEAIIDGIHNCRIMVLLLSSNANNSIHIAKEVERAVSHGATLIPLRIEAVMPGKSLDYFIGSVHWLDALTPPLDRHLDSLADTILKILPAREPATPPEPVITLPPVVVVPPAPVAISTPAPAHVAPPIPAVPAKNKWLVPVLIGAGVLLIAMVALMATLVSNQGGNNSGSGTIVESTPSANQPTPSSPRPAPNNPVRSSSDAIVGCWHWFNNGTVVVNGNGLVIGGPFTGHWKTVDPARQVYALSWPEAVDSVGLSPDGRTLAGANQYGVPMSAARLGGGNGFPGTWRWYNGVTVTIQPDGTLLAGSIRAQWEGSGNAYRITWPGPVDTITLSADHTSVEGHNQYGVHISGAKTGNCR